MRAAGQFVMQGEEVRITPLGRQQRAGVIDDRGHYPAARCGWLVIQQPGLEEELAGPLPGRRRQWAGARFDIRSPVRARPPCLPPGAAARAFSVAASASQADTGLPSSAAAALIVSLQLGEELRSTRFRTVIPPS